MSDHIEYESLMDAAQEVGKLAGQEIASVLDVGMRTLTSSLAKVVADTLHSTVSGHVTIEDPSFYDWRLLTVGAGYSKFPNGYYIEATLQPSADALDDWQYDSNRVAITELFGEGWRLVEMTTGDGESGQSCGLFKRLKTWKGWRTRVDQAGATHFEPHGRTPTSQPLVPTHRSNLGVSGGLDTKGVILQLRP